MIAHDTHLTGFLPVSEVACPQGPSDPAIAFDQKAKFLRNCEAGFSINTHKFIAQQRAA
jgi:hypothetical protein